MSNPADVQQDAAGAAEVHRFDTEVEQLLGLMINALYSNREIFLRELISNASDALDKLRFEALTDEALKGLDQDPRITVTVDAEARRLEIEDNGIGMSRQEVIENLGTVARSGTARFLEQLSGDGKADARLIGQFGVGFYSAFIVASQVTVETLRAGADPSDAVTWSSDGKGEYTLATGERSRQGTRVVLELAEDHRDLADADRVRGIVRLYSNHVSFPIRILSSDADSDAGPVNDTQALWTRSRNEIGEAEYREFYRGISGDFRDPATWAHHHVEGNQSYSMLLYVPGQAPFDLAWNRDDRRGLKLYIQRVFIMDAAEQLLPRYLRFVRGVVDSADLPLNISREILQDNPLLDRIRATVTRRSLDMIEKLASDGGEAWQTFQAEFGSILKEGVIESGDQRERVAGLLRFASTHTPEAHAVSLEDYLQRAGAGCETIWYLTADRLEQAKASPHLEAFADAGVEVLLLTDPIDVWLVGHLGEFRSVPLKSAASGEFSKSDADAEGESEDGKALCGRIKKALGERVGNVTVSRRLHRSASCISAAADGMGLQMRRMLRQAGQTVPETRPDLEVNIEHALLRKLEASDDDALASELSHLLMDQALLVEGGELADPAAFVARVNRLLTGLEEKGAAPGSGFETD